MRSKFAFFLYASLDFRIKIEKRFDTLAKLLFYLLASAFQNVHRDTGIFSVLELHFGIADFDQLVRGEESHSVNQRQVCHSLILLASPVPQQRICTIATRSFRIQRCESRPNY